MATSIQAGPETDAEIARRVFGHTAGHECPFYSTYIAVAWLVVEKMREMGIFMSLHEDDDADLPWEAIFFGNDPDDEASMHGIARGTGPTAPLAICRAALEALDSRTELDRG